MLKSGPQDQQHFRLDSQSKEERPHMGMLLNWGDMGAWMFDHIGNKIR